MGEWTCFVLFVGLPVQFQKMGIRGVSLCRADVDTRSAGELGGIVIRQNIAAMLTILQSSLPLALVQLFIQGLLSVPQSQLTVNEGDLAKVRPADVLVGAGLPCLADLCTNGKRGYSYARVVYPQAGTNGPVAVPRREGRFGLLRIFRHAPRTECMEFPRGFAEKGLSPEENIRKELSEEMGAAVREVRYLGSVRPDTGLSAGCAQVFLAEVEEAAAQVGHEGIRELVWLTEEELRQDIAAGGIIDGITLSALALSHCEKIRGS